MFATLLRASKKSPYDNYQHAVLVVCGGAVKAIGYNTPKCHAEVHALKKLWPSERKKCKIYSVRFTKAGKLSMAKPCDECQKYLKANGIRKVTYSDGNGKLQVLRIR